jgi:hypothetical protein
MGRHFRFDAVQPDLLAADETAVEHATALRLVAAHFSGMHDEY